MDPDPAEVSGTQARRLFDLARDPAVERAGDTDAGPPAPRAPAAVGGRIGDLELLAELGRGGAGVVYRARDRIGREVAVKLLSAGGSAAYLERFEREGRVTASLDHPGIVRVHAAGQDGGRAYLVYELVEGCRTLAELLPGLERARGLELLRDVARALGYAHARGVVHRDVKPANVLVDAHGRARVSDFGLARVLEEQRRTQTGTVMGTPLYMSPEQADGRPDATAPPTDVWALGVVLYQLLTGQVPFTAPSPILLRLRIIQGELRPPRELDPQVPPDLEAVCLRALRTEPAERYPDAGRFADDLDDVLAGRPPRLAGGDAPRPRGRRRRALALAGALAALGAVAAWRALGPGRRGTDEVAAPETAAAAQERAEAEQCRLQRDLDAARDAPAFEALLAEAVRLGPRAGAWLETTCLLALDRVADAEAACARGLAAGPPLPGLVRARGLVALATGRGSLAELAADLQALPAPGDDDLVAARQALDALAAARQALEARPVRTLEDLDSGAGPPLDAGETLLGRAQAARDASPWLGRALVRQAVDALAKLVLTLAERRAPLSEEEAGRASRLALTARELAAPGSPLPAVLTVHAAYARFQTERPALGTLEAELRRELAEGRTLPPREAFMLPVLAVMARTPFDVTSPELDAARGLEAAAFPEGDLGCRSLRAWVHAAAALELCDASWARHHAGADGRPAARDGRAAAARAVALLAWWESGKEKYRLLEITCCLLAGDVQAARTAAAALDPPRRALVEAECDLMLGDVERAMARLEAPGLREDLARFHDWYTQRAQVAALRGDQAEARRILEQEAPRAPPRQALIRWRALVPREPFVLDPGAWWPGRLVAPGGSRD